MPVMNCIWMLSWFMNLNKEHLLRCVCGVSQLACDPAVVDSIFTARNLKRLSGMVRLLFCSRQRQTRYRFLNRCRQLYRCQQQNQDISELFNLADQALFSSLQKNSHHVLHRLLPAKSTQPYNLHRRHHSFSLTQKQSSYDDCNFITRMLFYHIY